MKLTSIQKQILLHRLNSGCIPEVLADTEELNITEEEAEIAQERIKMFVMSGQVPTNSLTKTEKEVLKDSMAGSTWFACAESGYSDNLVSIQKINADNRSADELENKWFLETNERVSIPRD